MSEELTFASLSVVQSGATTKREEGSGSETVAWIAPPLPEEGATAGSEAPSLEGEIAGWTNRDEAYANTIRLLDAMTSSGYLMEVFLELIGDWYQVVVRSEDGELICKSSEQVEDLIWHAQNGTL